MKPLDWETIKSKHGISHVLPMYEPGKMQPGHIVDSNCNCWTQVRRYPNGKIIVVHRIIQ